MPFVFTIQNNPLPDDKVTLSMTDGNSVNRVYEYTVLEGDTLQSVSDGLKALVNADTYFTAIDQTTFPDETGLQVSQVATDAYANFAGLVFITVNPVVISEANTMVFVEGGAVNSNNSGFEGFRSYHPENWCCLGTLLISWVDGTLWTHDSAVYNNWYGVQYESYIKGVFNESPLQKKTFLAIQEISNFVWDCPEISTSINSIQPLGIKQESKLIEQDFTLIEGNYNASFLMDQNSPGGIIEGYSLKGVYMIIKFRAQTTQTFQYMYLGLVTLLYIDSPLNTR